MSEQAAIGSLNSVPYFTRERGYKLTLSLYEDIDIKQSNFKKNLRRIEQNTEACNIFLPFAYYPRSVA